MGSIPVGGTGSDSEFTVAFVFAQAATFKCSDEEV